MVRYSDPCRIYFRFDSFLTIYEILARQCNMEVTEIAILLPLSPAIIILKLTKLYHAMSSVASWIIQQSRELLSAKTTYFRPNTCGLKYARACVCMCRIGIRDAAERSTKSSINHSSLLYRMPISSDKSKSNVNGAWKCSLLGHCVFANWRSHLTL